MDNEWMKDDGRTLDEILARREADKRKADAQAEALAAEEAAVYNLDLIRKLERRAARLESDNMAQAKHIEVLTRLVVRIGHDLNNHFQAGRNPHPRPPYTPAGQRQRDAACHEAEGPPPDAGMLEGIQ